MDNTKKTEFNEAINAKILAVSEDKLHGFHRNPFHQISKQSGVKLDEVISRIKKMTKAGVIRRTRLTLLANKLAEGALVAWEIEGGKLDEAFNFMSKKDPFSGHVVYRSTDNNSTGSNFKLWTTVKTPLGTPVKEHVQVLAKIVSAKKFVIMPPKGIFTLGVGHVRRKNTQPGEKSEIPAKMITTTPIKLNDDEWKVILAIKDELSLEEISENPWIKRATKAEMNEEKFFKIAEDLDKKGIVGRFSTFLEHVKPSAVGNRVTRFNALFHWRVAKGMEKKAGSELGRHHIMTHAYWREGGENFNNVNIMGVAHGTDKTLLLEHKKAIDNHLKSCDIGFDYTNVFWGGRSEIKPSEISPLVYTKWHQSIKNHI